MYIKLQSGAEGPMTLFAIVLWVLLFLISWPIALLVLLLYPVIWVLMLPLRLFGIAVDVVFETLRAILLFPARLLRGAFGR
jgi:hypothetical protein